MTYIKFFSDISKKDRTAFGGKSVALGRMLQAGIPIPNGFAIAATAQQQFTGKPFSHDFKNELTKAFTTLSCEHVAVRSSARAEDSLAASWAGQFESYLNVDQAEMEDSIRKCWKSAESDRVKDYAHDKNISGSDLAVGVVVQVMIPADRSGVMFTANPVTNSRAELIIEACFGLGELLVQGTITPDRYAINKRRSQVIEYSIQIKQKMMIAKNGVTKIVAVPEHISDRAVLTESQILEIAHLGKNIERYFDMPQDIEWCMKDSKIYVVQARPITTLSSHSGLS